MLNKYKKPSEPYARPFLVPCYVSACPLYEFGRNYYNHKYRKKLGYIWISFVITPTKSGNWKRLIQVSYSKYLEEDWSKKPRTTIPASALFRLMREYWKFGQPQNRTLRKFVYRVPKNLEQFREYYEKYLKYNPHIHWCKS